MSEAEAELGVGLLTRECWRRGSLLRTAWAGPGPRIAEDWADTDTGGPAQHQTGTRVWIMLASHVIIWPDECDDGITSLA